jgi:hypothetical protein
MMENNKCLKPPPTRLVFQQHSGNEKPDKHEEFARPILACQQHNGGSTNKPRI